MFRHFLSNTPVSNEVLLRYRNSNCMFPQMRSEVQDYQLPFLYNSIKQQGVESIGIAGSAIPGNHAFGRKEGVFQYGARKILVFEYSDKNLPAVKSVFNQLKCI